MDLARTIVLACALAAVGGCATMNTAHVADTDSGGEGIEYALPTAYFDLRIYDKAGDITVTLGSPRMIPDNDRRYRTRLLSGGTADNEFTVKVGPDGLLSSVAGSSDGKVADIATNLAKSVSIQAGREDGPPPFFNHPYRFDEYVEAARAANRALVAYIDARCARPPRDASARAHCKALARSVPVEQRGSFITLSSATEVGSLLPLARLNPAATADRGGRDAPHDALFYHPLAPFQLTLSLANGDHQSDIYSVPDKSRIDRVRAPAGVFAKQEYDFAFSAGVLTSYKRVARNEVVGLVSLPLQVVKAVIAAPAEVLAERKAASQATADYLEAVAIAGEQAKSAREACAGAPALCGGSVYRLIRVSTESGPKPADTQDANDHRNDVEDSGDDDDDGNL